ncbi:MAG TPA: NTP transferase domain-containing protein, partial [Exilispira sp.]|nr:NTP transferase domain-containing protein [Exilispira sp.]
MRCIILAAGKGKRLQSEEFQIPKALRLLNGKPLLSYVLESISGFIEDRDIVIVVGFMGEKIIELYKDKGRYNFVWQKEQLGTGHAVMMAEDYFEANCNLILMGDMPFIKESTLREFLTFHDKNKNCFLNKLYIKY